MKGVAAIFAYSKTKGLFAGVSLEGSGFIERRDANEKLYNAKVTARQLLEGSVRPPPAADPLMNVLNSRVFSGNFTNGDAMYNDIPIYDDSHDNVVWEGRTGQGYGAGLRKDRTGTTGSNNDEYEYRDNAPPKRASTWADDVYDQPTGNNRTSPGSRANPTETFDRINRTSRSNTTSAGGEYSYSDQKPTRPTAPKPVFKPRTGSLNKDQAKALFTFDPDQDGDLAFKKGDIITITKRTENKEDWWTGRIGDRTGVFPSNYVELVTQ